MSKNEGSNLEVNDTNDEWYGESYDLMNALWVEVLSVPQVGHNLVVALSFPGETLQSLQFFNLGQTTEVKSDNSGNHFEVTTVITRSLSGHPSLNVRLAAGIRPTAAIVEPFIS